MNKLLSMIALMFTMMNAWGQSQMNGVVLDAQTNLPLVGASIKTDLKQKTTSDLKGVFSITCADSMQVTVSYVGYHTFHKIVVNCDAKLKVELRPKKEQLNAVEVNPVPYESESTLLVPNAHVSIDSTAINRGTGLFLKDALNTSVPGVTMQSRTSSAGQQINIRGYGNGLGFKGANNNFDGQGSKVYLNGIAITDAEGVTMLDDIDFGSINKVSVDKGPSGTLYGLAIAGVVNLETQKASKNSSSIGQDVLLGAYGLARTTTRLAIGGVKSSLLINYGHQKFDGFMDHTAAQKDFVNVVGDFQLSDKQSLTTYFGYANSDEERNGELTAEQYDALDYAGNARYIANDAHAAVQTFRAGIGHTYQLFPFLSNTTSLFGSSQKMDNSSAGGWSDKAPLNVGFRSVFNLNFNLSEKVRLKGIVGTEIQKMNTLAMVYSMGTDSTNLEGYNVITALKSIQETSSATAAYFAQFSLLLPYQIAVTTGVGVSNMKLRLDDRLWGINNNSPNTIIPPYYEQSYTNLLSPSVAVNKKINKNASVYASYATGYKAPVSSQFYIPVTGEVNQGLKPEKGTQIELGTKGYFLNHKLYYSVAVFNARFSDKMTMLSVQNDDNTATLYTYVQNDGDLNNKGLELLVSYELMDQKDQFFRSVRPFFNLTYSDFKYDGFKYQKIDKTSNAVITEDYTGNQVAGVPPLVFNAGVDVMTKLGVFANVNFNYRDAMFYTSDQLNQTDAFSILNAKVGYNYHIKHFDVAIYAGGINLTNSQYYHMVFVNQLPDAYIPAAREANFYGGINLKYIF